MMARTLSSLSAASNASISSCCMVPLKALSLSGRFRVMVRICSATSYLIVSYAMGGSFLFCCSSLAILSSFRGDAKRRARNPFCRAACGSMDSGPAPLAHPGMTRKLLPWRGRPRLLRAAQGLERLGHAEHAEIVETPADDLHADRKALFVVA